LVQVFALPILVLVWDRFFTAPLRALSPTGLFTAISLPSFFQLVAGTISTAKQLNALPFYRFRYLEQIATFSLESRFCGVAR
jgi:hypothetical protein